MTIAELNALDHEAFVAAVGWVFERSPWVTERVWSRRPFATLDQLHAAMANELSTGTRDELLTLLRAHPDLGSRAKMTDASVREQAGAGLDSLTPFEFTRLRRLNDAYRDKFGFPFLYAVKGGTKHDILRALETRTSADREEEFREALSQVLRIARFRLEDTLS